MMYFTPTNELNGALETVPGSHVNWWTDDFKVHEDWFRKHPEAEVVVSNPGDLVVTDARTLHATTANTSQEPRMMATLWYLTDWQNMTPEFRAFKAMRDEAHWAPFGDLWPSTDRPFAEYRMRNAPRPEDMRAKQ
jgi:ectoine hydroxylase-related dioxygenase (phytanoyl-CoA dioxygenase family)